MSTQGGAALALGCVIQPLRGCKAMPRHKPLPEPVAPTPPPQRWRRWVFQFLLVLTVAALLLGGLYWAVQELREQLHGRHEVAYSDIQCKPPAGMTRQEFLEEVQYF